MRQEHLLPDRLLDEIGFLATFLEQVEGLRFVMKDRAHRYEFVSEGWLKSVALNDVVGCTVFDVFPAWRAERYFREEKRVMEKGAIIDTFEELMLVDGGRKEVWRSLKGPRVRDGKIVGMVILGMLVDPDLVKARLLDERPEAVQWMERHAAESKSIGAIAQELSMSRRSLERYFLQQTGMSPAQYRSRCRLSQARHLLEFSAKPIVQIARSCGFQDQSHFTNAFRKEFRITPAKWRKSTKL